MGSAEESHDPEAVKPLAEATAAPEPPSVSVVGVFKFADRVDVTLMLVGGVAAFINGAGLPAFSIIFGDILGELSTPGGDVEAAVRRLAIAMVIVGIVVFILSALQVGMWMVSSMRQVGRIRATFFHSALRQDMAWHDEHKPGELTAIMDGDTRVIMNGINDKASNGIFQLGMALFGYGVGFYEAWQLTLVMLGLMPLIAVVGGLMAVVMTRLSERSREGYAKAGEIATELLENVRTVQVFGQEERDLARFATALAPTRAAAIKRDFVSVASVGVTYGVMFSSYSLAFWFASYLIVNGHSDVGRVTGAFFAVLMGSFAVGLLFPSIAALSEARGAAKKVYDICDRLPAIDVLGGGAVVRKVSESIALRGVNFRYPSRREQPLLEGFNVVIPRGRKVAFSGPSGCGKSTIVALLQRFYDADSGAVEVDGVDLKTVDLRQWRDRIGVVSQEPALFIGTIEENVRVGKSDATREEVMEACRKAQIHDVVMTLPDGYDTSVGAVGSQLSGGQKQRIAIARAIIRAPELLILDEATSALDRKSEVDVQRTLDEVMRSATGESLTVVVIAHRLATIRNVDQIYFMEADGERGSSISEVGTYDELMARQGKFAAMAARQDATATTETSADAGTDLKVDGSADAAHEQLAVAQEAELELSEAPVPWLRVLRMNGPNCLYVLLGVIGSIASGLIYPAYAIIFSEMLDTLARTENLEQVKSNARFWSPMFLVIGGGALVGWVLQGNYSVAGERLTSRLRYMILEAALRQEMAFFDTPGHDAGAISAVLSGDAEAVHQLWGPALGFRIQSVCNLAGGIVIALVFNWRIALVVLSLAPALVLSGALQQMLLVGFGHEAAGASEDSVKTEALSNIRTVASFNLQQNRMEAYASKLRAKKGKVVSTGLITGIGFGFSQFALYAVFALGFWYGGRLLQRGEATFKEILIATMGVLMGALGAGEAGGFAAKVADAQTASKKVFALIDRRPRIDADAGGAVVSAESPSILFGGVAFRYPARPDMPVLRGVSEVFPFGMQNGVMGQTGCGKSTIVQLLARFYDPDGGAVTVDGTDLRDLDLRRWRSSVSVVMQEPALFSGTVRENILYGRPDASDEDVLEAARRAHIHDDVLAMPHGYDTGVGYRGRELSGGQKQRVAIARALIRRPRLLLLDEATSALDNATEQQVQRGIDEFRRSHPMTTLSVAHRLTTIQDSDSILVMDKGRVIERGTHPQLMAHGGEYRVRYDLFSQSQ